MKIGIDGTTLSIKMPNGSKTYSQNLLFALSKVDRTNIYYIFSSSKVDIPKQKNFIFVKTLPLFRSLSRQPFLFYYVNKIRPDIFHFLSPYGDILLKHNNIVTTLHDTGLGRSYPLFSKYFLKRLLYWLNMAIILRRSRSIIVPTSQVMKELLRVKFIRKNKIDIKHLHYGIGNDFYVDNKVKKQDFLLCMADFTLRKNTANILRAYDTLPSDIKLRYGLKIVSSSFLSTVRCKRLVSELGLEQYVEILTNVSNKKLNILYNSAICFLYPSLYEGFGFPILEAMSCGCPVITSNYGATKEVANNAALLVNPRSVKQIRNALNKILNSYKLRKDYVKLGLSRVKYFSWKNNARQTLELYRKMNKRLPPSNNRKFTKPRWLLLLLLMVYLLYILNKPSWSTFLINGKIPDKLYIKNSTLMFGTGNSKLFFLDTKDAKKTNTIDFNSGIAKIQKIIGNDTLVISDDTLKLIEVKSQKVIWQVDTGNEYFFETAEVYKNYVLAGSADGSLTALNLRNGKILWKFTPKRLEKLSSISAGGYLHYFGSIKIVGNRIFLDSQDNTFYTLNLKNGAIVWQSEIGEPINTDIKIYRNYIYVTTRTGTSIALDRKTGKKLWSNSDFDGIVCSNIRTTFIESEFLPVQILFNIKQQVLKIFSKEKIAIFELAKDGWLIRRDGRTGQIVWKSQPISPETYCPSIWRSSAIMISPQGDLISKSLVSGDTIYEKHDLGTLIDSLVIVPRLDFNLTGKIDLLSPYLIFNNSEGVLRTLNADNGENIWEFNAKAPTYTGLLVDKKNIFFATADGVIYKLNKKTGQPELDSNDKKFDVWVTTINVAGTEILEINLKSKGTFTNHWREATLDATFTNESGGIVKMPGFYYDQNVWKVRFNPPDKGVWKWELNWSPHGANLTKSGEFISKTDTSTFYLRTNKINPRRLTVDGNTIFNGMGLGDTFYDYNYNGTSLDDWALGNSNPLAATSASGFVSYYKSDVINLFDDYVSTYGPDGAGFNIFRWSLMNASQSLYTNLGFPTTYSTLQTKIGDRYVETLRKNNIHIWLTLFGFDIPYKNSSDYVDRYVLKSYVRYVFARYAAFTDVWEVANELGVPEDTANFIKNEIRSLDYENRPISISSNFYNVQSGDIVAPHWYETEDITKSDYVTTQKIDEFMDSDKPLVFAEQGNLSVNYDSTSATRMRIRLWTAFFNEAVLMFWNQSDSKDFKAGIFPGNLYIGEEERKYTKVLQHLSDSFPLESKTVKYNLEKYGVRGYGLNSDKINAGYFYHYGSPFKDTSIEVTVHTKSGGTVAWIDPTNGNMVGNAYCKPESCTLYSPNFKTDILMYIKSI